MLFIYRHKGKKDPVPHMRSHRLVLIMLAAGLTTAFGNQIALSLSGRLPAIIQFPTMNGGTVILATLFAVIVYRERMTRSRRGRSGARSGRAGHAQPALNRQTVSFCRAEAAFISGYYFVCQND
jgi:hypothetical protein